MREFTKKSLVESVSSPLYGEVVDYMLSVWEESEDKGRILDEVIEHGCKSGVVPYLVYHEDTLKFYETHKGEINVFLSEVMDEFGYASPLALFGDEWDRSDPLALHEQNQNLLAWFGFEECTRRIAMEFGL